jgi:thymidylate synthase (FAD)
MKWKKSMNTAKIIAVTQPLITDPKTNYAIEIDEFVAYVARVSNPGNQHNHLSAPKLLRYLAKHRHWSPFEMVDIVMEINTTRDIGRQVLRHRSFSFQEFSQRYADPTKEMGFVCRDARLQDMKNRQNSIETDDKELITEWIKRQAKLIEDARDQYNWAIENSIAKEQARAILPEGLILSRMYMKGSLRSWIHYCKIRTGIETQKEHREIALDAWYEVTRVFPSLKNALDIGEK